MKRNNAAVKIPPNPPKSTTTTYKPVQIGVAPTTGNGSPSSSSSRPAKPKRGVPKSDSTTSSATSQFFYSQDTLSDVKITFSKTDSDQKQTLCSAGEWREEGKQTIAISSDKLLVGENAATQPLYENVSRKSDNCISPIVTDSVESKIESDLNALSLTTSDRGTIQSNADGDVKVQPTSESTPPQRNHVKLRQCDTFDNLQVGQMCAPLYENVNWKAGRKGTYLVPDELLENENSGIDNQTSTSLSTSCHVGHTDQVRVEVEPPADQTSHPPEETNLVEPTTLSKRPPLRPPAPYLNNTIYKDPLSLFESSEPDRLSVGGQQFSAFRSKSASNLSESSGSRATTIQDSGSEVSSVDRNSDNSRANTFEDFVVLRRHKGGGKGARQRAVSELITTDELRNSNRQSGWFEALKQSFFGSNSVDSTHNTKRTTSTFYVDHADDDDEVLYSSLDIPVPQNISSRVKRKLPESLVTNLTPAVFQLPQDQPSVFYTDQEEHIYCSSETLGSLSFPEVSVQNLGYRDPQVRAVEQLEQSIPVRDSRSKSEGGLLYADKSQTTSISAVTSAATDGATSTSRGAATGIATSAAARAKSFGIRSGYDDLGSFKTETDVRNSQHERAVEEGEVEVSKMRVSRVSMMKQKFDRPSSDDSSSDEKKVRLRDRTDAGKLVRKQIVSQQFSSNVLEIQQKIDLMAKSHVNGSNGR